MNNELLNMFTNVEEFDAETPKFNTGPIGIGEGVGILSILFGILVFIVELFCKIF